MVPHCISMYLFQAVLLELLFSSVTVERKIQFQIEFVPFVDVFVLLRNSFQRTGSQIRIKQLRCTITGARGKTPWCSRSSWICFSLGAGVVWVVSGWGAWLAWPTKSPVDVRSKLYFMIFLDPGEGLDYRHCWIHCNFKFQMLRVKLPSETIVNSKLCL